MRYELKPEGLDVATRWLEQRASNWDRRLQALARRVETQESRVEDQESR